MILKLLKLNFLLFLLIFPIIVFTQNQDINLAGNGIDIFNGGANSPSITNDTDFEDVELGSIFQVTFTIQNTKSGGSPKNNKLTVSDISISGVNASDFVVSGISLPKSINRSGSTTFDIIFSATTIGSKTASVSIVSDDPDENPYTFNISGNVIEAGTDPSLTLTNTYALSVLEPSGLAFNKTNNELFTVSDNTGFVYRMSTTGVVQQTLSYTGADLEGVSMYTSNKILVAVEGTRELVEYDYVNDVFITSHVMNYTNTDLSATGDNSRIEGVTYDGVNDIIYFLNEKNPGALIKADGNFNVTDEYPLSFAGDYSASYYVEETGFLWLASDQESTVYKCNTDGTIVYTFPVTNAGGGTIDKLEGIAIDHANQLLYAVSDLGQELYVFSINNDAIVDPPTIATVSDTFPTLDGVNGETTSTSVLDNDTLNSLPATTGEVSLLALSILDSNSSPTTDIVLNSDGTITVLSNTATGDYSLTYEICELLDLANCSQITNTISILGPAPSTSDVIIAGDSWKYYDNQNEPSGSWKGMSYDDSTWSIGNAVLGFNNSESTTLNSAITTAYFRKTIQITNASSITGIDLSAIRDDGMIVYVNGNEVWRDNMPTGNVTYDTQASSDIKDTAETTWVNQNISNSLVEGNNIVAVEIHIKKPKGRNKTPDMSFDFSMTTTTSAASRIANITSESSKLLNKNSINDVVLYPVPLSNELNIRLNNKEKLISVNIINQNGRLLLFRHNNKIDVSSLKEGIYIVEIETNSNKYYKKIIIK